MTTLDKTYVHKGRGDSAGFGEIGKAAFVLNGTITMDGKALGPNALLHALSYAAQSLTDSYAGAESRNDAIAAFKAKKAKIADDSIGTRADSSDPMVTFIRAVVRQSLTGKRAVAGIAYKKLKETAVKARFLDDYLVKQSDGYKAKVAELAQVAYDEAAARKTSAAALGDI